MRNLIIFSYFFPPMGGGAVLRALKFVKYLPAFAWRPLVVAGAGPYHVRDAALADDIPAEVVIRWAGSGNGPPPPAPALRGKLKRRLGKRWARWFAFPDGYAAFARPAAAAARSLADKYGAAAVLSTAPPFTSHVVAARLAGELSLPLVLDYRDAWTDNPFAPFPTRWHAARAGRAEDAALACAAAVVAVTAGMAAGFGARLGAGTPALFIPNGYDEADFAGAAPPTARAFAVAYAGQLYGGRMPWTFLAGAAAFARERRLADGDFAVNFLGPIGPSVLTRARGFGIRVDAAGVVSHQAAVAAMRGADVNLLLIGDEPGAGATLTGKVFEYLRAGRPILALVPPDGEAAALIRGCDAGVVVAPDDASGVAAALARLYAERGTPPGPAPPALARYERKNLTGELAALLDRVARRS